MKAEREVCMSSILSSLIATLIENILGHVGQAFFFKELSTSSAHAGLLLNNLSVIRGLELMFDSYDILDRSCKGSTALTPECRVRHASLQVLIPQDVAQSATIAYGSQCNRRSAWDRSRLRHWLRWQVPQAQS